MTIHSAAFKELRKSLRPDEWTTDKGSLYAASMDNMRYSQMPSVRIFPHCEESIATVLQLANRYCVPVTTRGSGSATTGTTTPVAGGWVIDLSRWQQIEIDATARMAFVQPGATLEQIDNAAAAHGLSYPVDPGSRSYASIGGSIATNAGGMRAAKYGVTRDFVLCLEGYLPIGEFVRWGGNYHKYAAGFNVRDLWIGSEGALGIITGIVLKLVPRPAAKAMAICSFPSDTDALNAVQRLLHSQITPSACEFLDQQTMAAAYAFWRKKAPDLMAKLPALLKSNNHTSAPPAILLLEVDGPLDSIEPQLDAALAALHVPAYQYNRCQSDDEMQLLWKIRKACSQAMFELGKAKLNEDVVVPLAAQIELMHFVRQLNHDSGLPTPTFGHVADGNFHVHIMYDPDDPAQRERAAAAVHSLMECVVNLGGAISGEHGIGIAKSAFLPIQHSNAEIKAMRAIKDALDPKNILNPHKMFAPVLPWSLPRESVHLPWDH